MLSRGRFSVRAGAVSLVVSALILGASPRVAASLQTAVVTQPAARETSPSLAGFVRAEGYRGDGFLVGAVVELRQGNRSRLVVVDSTGRYRMDGLVPGPASLWVFHIAAHPLETEVLLPHEGVVTLDLSLGLRVIPIPGVRANALPGLNGPARPLTAGDPRRVSMAMRALEASSGMAESGLASAFPGDDGGEPERVLYLRGSTVDARLVLLDGAPVLTPFHVAGLVEPFDSELLRSADLYLGGAPSPYEGGISYLLDMDTRAARTDRLRGSVSADGVAVRGVAEVPLPLGGGLLVGARKLHGLQEKLGDGGRFPYDYRDVLLRVGFGSDDGHAVRATAFSNREVVRLDYGPLPAEGGPDAVWGNRVASVGYEGWLGRVRLEAIGATSRYGSHLPVSWEEPVLARGTAERHRAGAVAMVPINLGEVRFGGSVERVRFGYRLEPLASTAVTQVSSIEEQLETTVAGMFGEWEGSVAPDVRVRAGLRGDVFTHQGGARMAPRLEVRFTLTDRAVLVASGGRYHQVLPAPGLRTETADGAPAAIAWEPRLPVVSASHLVVGLEQELDRGFRLGVAGFVKGFSGLGAIGDRTRSSGTELRVNRSGERVKAWLGYALSWSWTEEVRGGTTRFDGRHLVSLGVEGTLGGLELGSTLGYGAGLPLSAVDVVGTSGDRGRADAEGFAPTTENRLNAGGGETPLELAPQDDFLRLDLEAAWPFALTVRGWHVEMRPYLKVLNALDRRDALFYYFDRWREEGLTPVTSRPFVPLVGVQWRF